MQQVNTEGTEATREENRMKVVRAPLNAATKRSTILLLLCVASVSSVFKLTAPTSTTPEMNVQ